MPVTVGQRIQFQVDFRSRIDELWAWLVEGYGLGETDRPAMELVCALALDLDVLPPQTILDADCPGPGHGFPWWSLGGHLTVCPLDAARGVRPRTAGKLIAETVASRAQAGRAMVWIDSEWRRPTAWHRRLCNAGKPVRAFLDNAIRAQIRTPASPGSFSADARNKLNYLAGKVIQVETRSRVLPSRDQPAPDWLRRSAELSIKLTSGICVGEVYHDQYPAIPRSTYWKYKKAGEMDYRSKRLKVGCGPPQAGREMAWEPLVSGTVHLAGRRAALYGRQAIDDGDWAFARQILAWQCPVWTRGLVTAIDRHQSETFANRLTDRKLRDSKDLQSLIGSHCAALGHGGIDHELARLTANGVIQRGSGAAGYTITSVDRADYKRLLNCTK